MSAMTMQLTVITDGNNIAYAVLVHMLTNVWVTKVNSAFQGMSVQ